MTTPTSHENQTNARAALLAKLAALGVAYVHVEYDGSGDSGCIGRVELCDAAHKEIEPLDEKFDVTLFRSVWRTAANAYQLEPEVRTLSADEAVHEWCYDLLEQHFAGWENDDGAYGAIEFDVAKETIELTHNSRISAIHTETVEA